MINKKKNKYIPVLINKKEFDLYEKIVNDHNYKGIRYLAFFNVNKLSFSKLISQALRYYVNEVMLKTPDDWDYFN